jgi:glucose-6-phosphate isomerase
MPQDTWKLIEEHPLKRLDELFAGEPDRLSRLTQKVSGLYFDWSKTHLDEELVEAFVGLTDQVGFTAAREALFQGEIVNPTEHRPADHVAERGSGEADAVELAASRRSRMRALVDAIEAGAFGDVTAILHIGIGGSALGPELLVDALGRRGAMLSISFLSNIDSNAFEEAVELLDPATTLIVAASKTFTTAETLANLSAATDWLSEGGVDDPFGRVIAVTAAPEAAVATGIDESRILQFSKGVGGRYSLWSSVSISAALALGWDAFEEFSRGPPKWIGISDSASPRAMRR